MSRQRGFSLIELLLSMAILAMVIFIGSFSFSIYSKLWNKDIANYNKSLSSGKTSVLLSRMFQHVSNYIVHDKRGLPVYYFVGNNHSMSFVTRSPLISDSPLALVKLEVKTLSDGNNILVYQEADLVGEDFFSLDSLPAMKYKLNLFESPNIRFNYFGWTSNEQRMLAFDREQDEDMVWQPDYSAEISGVLPEVVNLTWGENEPVLFALQHDGAIRLQYTGEKRNGE
ncbi:prepilin-type N-terminal cleavage/methylation domain-containing protein [Shewanella sp. FJAT-52076]|uniref:prepilin-type N-terminal cleavage/methylation domain-containing protein n=1 Tax=Shewanella sp. FJAT-52076 TaxID=2864202 RepID=UPI001C654D2D|nr:prepilin-type N-terminal cleavage/methylation domain-containing protein [Shewanella sp. FJAT-52076]QYJ74054.1 prepilin-type N-terminal cleavage/methylation domain-containing protein [Shewanella sp. FJAT-52076]